MQQGDCWKACAPPWSLTSCYSMMFTAKFPCIFYPSPDSCLRPLPAALGPQQQIRMSPWYGSSCYILLSLQPLTCTPGWLILVMQHLLKQKIQHWATDWGLPSQRLYTAGPTSKEIGAICSLSVLWGWQKPCENGVCARVSRHQAHNLPFSSWVGAGYCAGRAHPSPSNLKT